MATPVVLTTGARPIIPVESGGVPMTPVDTLGEPVTVVDALGEPVVLINNDGTPAFLAYSAKTYLGGVAPYHWLDFVNNRALYAGADVGNVTQATGYSFTRASQGYYTNSDGTLTLFGYNLLTWSEDFSNAAWTQASLTIGADAGVAPNGTTTADSLTRTTTSSAENNERQTTAQAVSTSYTLSVYVKANTAGARLYLRNLAIDSSTTTGVVQFNPADGTISLTYGSTYTGKASMTNEGNGWYRCQITGSTGGSITNNLIDVGVTDGTSAVGGTAGNSIFAWGAQLDQAAQATAYVPTTSAAAGALRRGDRGVLIEGSRTNLLLRSQEFDNASWTKGGTTVTADSIAAPDGTTTADTIVETAALADHNVIQTPSVAANTTFTATAFVKRASGARQFAFQFVGSGGSDSFSIFYNLGTGAVGSSGTNGTASITSSSITALANGWYRCAVTAIVSTTQTLASGRWCIANGTTVGSQNYTGDGTSGLYLWGAQLEAASFPSSYIPTVAASATRAADVLTYTAGVTYPCGLWAEVVRTVNTGAPQVPVGVNLSASERSELAILADNTGRAYQVTGAALVGEVSNGSSLSLTAAIKMAGRFGTNVTQLSVNGGIGTQDASAAAPSSPTLLTIGTRNSSTDPVFGYIRRIAAFNFAPSDAQLQAMST